MLDFKMKFVPFIFSAFDT